MSFPDRSPRLIKTLLTKVRRQNLFAAGETVVVAVSGGADSVALLDLLAHLDQERLKLVVAHLNHCLRGADSDGDETFVSNLAQSYGVPFVSRRSNVAAFARTSGLSLEDAGRRARYAFFADVAKDHGATSIALAHHQDDQAETVLIRLLRGSGGTGLSAMANSAGVLKRPLLQVTKAEIEQYLKVRGLTHRVDSTNTDTAILRNSIRHDLLPLLKRYNPKISRSLAATAEILAGDEELLEHLTTSAYSRIAARDGADVVLRADLLAAEPRALRLRLYRRALLELRGDLQRIGLPHLDAVDCLVTSGRPSGRLKLPGDCFVQRNYDRVILSSSAVPTGGSWKVEVEGEGSYQLPAGGVLTVQRVAKPNVLVSNSRLVAYLALDAAPFPWTVRSFSPGDRFRPLGMEGQQKVKDLFINEKVPVNLRRRIPLLISGGDVVWVAGVRMGAKARVMAETESVVRVEILDFTP
jgi:tRNA(Ile)-lysidine synthase